MDWASRFVRDLRGTQFFWIMMHSEVTVIVSKCRIPNHYDDSTPHCRWVVRRGVKRLQVWWKTYSSFEGRMIESMNDDSLRHLVERRKVWNWTLSPPMPASLSWASTSLGFAGARHCNCWRNWKIKHWKNASWQWMPWSMRVRKAAWKVILKRLWRVVVSYDSCDFFWEIIWQHTCLFGSYRDASGLGHDTISDEKSCNVLHH